MIILTKVDGSPIVVNADEIETVEWSHDSTLTLKSGKKVIVCELVDEIIEKVIDYRRKCMINWANSPEIKEPNLINGE